MEYPLLGLMPLQTGRGMTARFDHARQKRAGFTLLEILMVVGAPGTLAAMAIMVSPRVHSPGEGRLRHAQASTCSARARDRGQPAAKLLIQFIGPNALQTVRQDIGANGRTGTTSPAHGASSRTGVQFRLEPGCPRYARPVRQWRRRSTSVPVGAVDVHERRHVRGRQRGSDQRHAVPGASRTSRTARAPSRSSARRR